MSALIAGALLALALPTVAEAKKAPKLTVMTRNVFLGADLSPAINAPTLAAAIDGAGVIWNEMQSTKFAERAKPLAREIKRSKADLVGLQEVALWRKQTPSDLGGPPQNPNGSPRLRSTRTSSRSSSASSSASTPATRWSSSSRSSTPSSGRSGRQRQHWRPRGADFDARLTMRDVILVRRASKLKLGKTRRGHFTTRYEPNVGGFVLPVDRGWASVEAKLGKKEFRFVDTHLEAFGDPHDPRGPGEGAHHRPAEDLAPGDPGRRPQLGYRPPQRARAARRRPRLHGTRRLRDEGQRRRAELLLQRPVRPRGHVRPHGRPRADQAGAQDGARRRDGQQAGERTPSGLWPSDHGGVVSTLRLK